MGDNLLVLIIGLGIIVAFFGIASLLVENSEKVRNFLEQ